MIGLPSWRVKSSRGSALCPILTRPGPLNRRFVHSDAGNTKQATYVDYPRAPAMETMIGSLRASRLSDRPVVEASSVSGYEPIFNAGLLYHEGTYHVFARGVRTGYARNPGAGARFLDYVSDILAFAAGDGVTYEFREVVAQGGQDGTRAVEVPRVHRVWSEGREHIVMTYTNLLA